MLPDLGAVTFIDPASPLLNAPNRITQGDFSGWVQERATYMPSTFDAHYRTVLAMNDPGEQPNRAAILAALGPHPEARAAVANGRGNGALRKLGITANGGQNQLKGRIIRIAHCGYFGAFDIIVTISALEMTLRELGHEAEPGAGVAAAQRVFSDAGVALHA